MTEQEKNCALYCASEIHTSAYMLVHANNELAKIEAQYAGNESLCQTDDKWKYFNNCRYFRSKDIVVFMRSFKELIHEPNTNKAIPRLLKAMEIAGCELYNNIDIPQIITLAPSIFEKEMLRQKAITEARKMSMVRR